MSDVKLTDEVLADLESKAKAATEGPWTEGVAGEVLSGDGDVLFPPVMGDKDEGIFYASGGENTETLTPDMAFITAANPLAVLALVAEVRRFRAAQSAAPAEVQKAHSDAALYFRKLWEGGTEVTPEEYRDLHRDALALLHDTAALVPSLRAAVGTANDATATAMGAMTPTVPQGMTLLGGVRWLLEQLSNERLAHGSARAKVAALVAEVRESRALVERVWKALDNPSARALDVDPADLVAALKGSHSQLRGMLDRSEAACASYVEQLQMVAKRAASFEHAESCPAGDDMPEGEDAPRCDCAVGLARDAAAPTQFPGAALLADARRYRALVKSTPAEVKKDMEALALALRGGDADAALSALNRLCDGAMEAAELRALFEKQEARVQEATALWQADHEKPDVLPDLGDLVTWLLKRVESVEAAMHRLRQQDTDRRAAVREAKARPDGAGAEAAAYLESVAVGSVDFLTCAWCQHKGHPATAPRSEWVKDERGLMCPYAGHLVVFEDDGATEAAEPVMENRAPLSDFLDRCSGTPIHDDELLDEAALTEGEVGDAARAVKAARKLFDVVLKQAGWEPG